MTLFKMSVNISQNLTTLKDVNHTINILTNFDLLSTDIESMWIAVNILDADTCVIGQNL